MNITVNTRPRVRVGRKLLVIGIVLPCLVGLPLLTLAQVTSVPSLATDTSLKLYTGTDSHENDYDFGYCTFWVSLRRAEVGVPIPQHWGDAHSWSGNALLSGYRVDHIPAPYAVMQTETGPLGHVAFVESVDASGGWTVSEMNVAGWDILSHRSFRPDQARTYNFIH